MKTILLNVRAAIVMLCLSWATITNAQVQPVGTVIGNQTVINVPISQSGQNSQALIYYPDDYFLPENANKKYPLFIFLHGAGEGNGNNISIVNNTSLPQLIAQGMKPFGIDSVTGEKIKFIVVSPHAANTGYSYSFPHVKWILADIKAKYRVDQTCMWVGGLSAGGRGAWSMPREEQAVSSQLAGIVTISALGYEGGNETNFNAAFRNGLACFNICGALDAHVATARAYNSTILGLIGANNPKKYWYYEVPGADHNSAAWNPPFQMANRFFNPTKNLWDLMVNIRRGGTAQPPPAETFTANAGNAQTVTMPQTISLAGTYNSLSAILGFKWTMESGPNTPTISTSTAQNTTVSGLQVGTYVFKFTVTNILGLSVSSNVSITVNAAAIQLPVVTVGGGTTLTLPTSSASLTGSATTPAGTTISTYAWTKVSGPAATISSPATANTNVTGMTTAGTYVFRLTVTNNTTGSSYKEVTVVVNSAAVQLPVVTVGGGTTITLPTSTASLTGSATTPAGTTISSYAWTKVSGPAGTISSPATANTNVTGLTTAGTYVFRLTVTNSTSGTSYSDVTIVVNAQPSNNNGNGLRVVDVAPTEYRCAWLYSDGKIRRYKFINSALRIDTMNIGNNKNIANISAGFNSTLAVATDGTVFLNRQGGAITTHLSTDTLGRAINDAVKSWGYFYDYMFLRADGSVWYFGNDDYGFLPGTAVITKPIQISPAGMKVKDVAMGGKVLFLTTNGEVWEMTKNSSTAVKKTLPAPAISITTGYLDYSVAIVPEAGGPQDAGYPYVWGNAYKYWGGSSAAAQPVALKTLWDVKQPIKQIVSSSNALHWIDVLGVRRGIGDNGNGEIGTGDEKYNKQELWSNPYSGAWHEGDPAFMINKPYELAPPAPGRVWNKLWSSVIFNFYVWASDDKDSTYFNGREKSLVGAKGIQLQNESIYPNGLDQVAPEQRSIMARQPVQYLNFVKYVVSAGADRSVATNSTNLSATGTASSLDQIAGWKWFQLAGPNTATLATPQANQTAVTGMVNGVYRFRVQMRDTRNGTISDTVAITVQIGAGNLPPTAVGGGDKTITLPTQTVTLTGSGIDADGTIASYRWAKISGPNTFTIVSPTQSQTVINNLVQGVYKFELTVTDNQGASGTTVVTVTVNAAANQLPTANGGGNKTITLPTSTVTLTGSGSDVDGTIASYAWAKISGPATFTIVSPTQAQTVINNLVQGTYQFELTVTDNRGGTAKSTVNVVVNAAPLPANQLPTANGGGNKTITLPISTVTLSGSGTDPDGTIVSYAWAKISGPATFTIVSPTQAQTVINNLVQGTYQYELTVTDDRGGVAKATVTVTVNAALLPANQLPTANGGGNKSITLPTSTVTLAGSGSDPDGTIVSYQWTKVSGPATFTIVSPTQAQTVINNLVQGTYQFKLTVTDNRGGTDDAVVTVTVNAAAQPSNQLPTANAGANKTITLPTQTVTLTGSGTDADGTVVSYQWTKISGPATFTIVSPTQAQTVINNLVQGSYLFELTVTDDRGGVDKDQVTVVVNAAPLPANQLPTANGGGNKTITLPVSTVTLSGSGSDPDGTIVSYAWAKISGPASFTIVSPTQAQTVINNLTAGDYQFELTVTDNNGGTAKDVVTVKVILAPTPANVVPTANAGGNKTITLPTSAVTLSGSGTDQDGTIVKYQWTKISGPASFTIVSPTQAQTVINNLVQGTYVFELTVTDDRGASAKSSATVVVNAAPAAPNQLPVANAGANLEITLPVDNVTLKGSGVDADGVISSYAWTKVSGPASYRIASPNSASTVVEALEAGTYVFELKVTDNSGATAKATVSVVVKPQVIEKSEVGLFPNPASDVVTIKISATTLKAPTNITVYNNKGMVVYHEQFMRQERVVYKRININRLTPGTYFVKVGVDINTSKTITLLKVR
jgi:hypothetical protein